MYYALTQKKKKKKMDYKAPFSVLHQVPQVGAHLVTTSYKLRSPIHINNKDQNPVEPQFIDFQL